MRLRRCQMAWLGIGCLMAVSVTAVTGCAGVSQSTEIPAITELPMRDTPVPTAPNGTSSPQPPGTASPGETAVALVEPTMVSAIIGPAPEAALARVGRGNSNALLVSPNGDMLVLESPLGLFAYDPTSLHLLWNIPTGGFLHLVGFFDGGSKLAVRTAENRLEYIEASSGVAVGSGTIPGAGVLSVAVPSKGGVAAAGSIGGEVLLWELNDASAVRRFEGHEDAVSVVQFSPSGELLASGADDSSIVVWNVSESGAGIGLQGHDSGGAGRGIAALAFSPDGNVLASGGYDGTVFVWDIPSGDSAELPRSYPLGIVSLAFSEDGATLAVKHAQGVDLWETGSLKEQLEVVGLDSLTPGLSFLPLAEEMITTSADNSVSVRATNTGDELRFLAGIALGPSRLAISPDGQVLATCMEDHIGRKIVVQLWDLQSLTRELPHRLDEVELDMHKDVERDDCLEVLFSEDGRNLWVGHGRGAAVLWDLDEHRAVWEGDEPIDPGRRFGWVAAVGFHDDDLVAQSDYEGGIRVTDLRGALPQGYLAWPDREVVYSITFSKEGTILAAGTESGRAVLFDLSSRSPIRTLEGRTSQLTSIRFLPDGQHLVGGYADGSLVFWEVGSGEMLGSVKGHSAKITDLVYLPLEDYLASASLDGDVKLWTVPGLRPIAALTGHSRGVTGLGTLTNPNRLVSTSRDGTAIIWPIKTK